MMKNIAVTSTTYQKTTKNTASWLYSSQWLNKKVNIIFAVSTLILEAYEKLVYKDPQTYRVQIKRHAIIDEKAPFILYAVEVHSPYSKRII